MPTPTSDQKNLFTSWLQSLFIEDQQPAILMLVAAVIWSNWKERNARIFLNKNLDADIIASKIVNLLNDSSLMCEDK